MKRLLPEDRQTDPSNKSPLITHSPTLVSPTSFASLSSRSSRYYVRTVLHIGALRHRASIIPPSSLAPALFGLLGTPPSSPLDSPKRLNRAPEAMRCTSLSSCSDLVGRGKVRLRTLDGALDRTPGQQCCPKGRGGKVTGHGVVIVVVVVVVVVVSPVLLPWSLGSGSRKSMLSPTPAPTPDFFLGTFSSS